MQVAGGIKLADNFKLLLSLAVNLISMRLFTVFFLLFSFFSMLAQDKKSMGVHLGIPIIHEKLTEGRKYKPFQLLFYYNFADLLKGRKMISSFTWSRNWSGFIFHPKTSGNLNSVPTWASNTGCTCLKTAA